MPIRLKSHQRFYKVLLTNRWSIVLFLIALNLAFEFIEHHYEFLAFSFSLSLLLEIILFAFAIPGLVGLTLHLLALSESRRLRAEANQSLFEQISKQIISINDWQELCEMIVWFPSTIVPFTHAYFLLQEELHSNTFALVSAKASTELVYPTQLAINSMTNFRQTQFQKLSDALFPTIEIPEGMAGYCLPFATDYACLGMLHLFLPQTEELSKNDIGVFNSLIPIIISGIIQLAPFKPNNIIQSDKERILLARHLHDTVGQNLGFLLLKLDTYKNSSAQSWSLQNKQALDEMYRIANEAYEEVRSTLTTLRPIETQDLAATLYQVAIVATNRRPTVEVQMIQEGQPVRLSFNMSQQIIAICREALTNVVKHAEASKVEIKLIWRRELLNISIADNGRGIQTETEMKTHYGMQMMFEQAAEIDATIQFNSQPEKGVEILFQVPLIVQPKQNDIQIKISR